HSNNPISSSIKEIRMIATNASVAFQTISVTAITSPNPTTPTIKARIAPPIADHPIDNPLGCQITKMSVTKKKKIAQKSKIKLLSILSSINHKEIFFLQQRMIALFVSLKVACSLNEELMYIIHALYLKNRKSIFLFFLPK